MGCSPSKQPVGVPSKDSHTPEDGSPHIDDKTDKEHDNIASDDNLSKKSQPRGGNKSNKIAIEVGSQEPTRDGEAVLPPSQQPNKEGIDISPEKKVPAAAAADIGSSSGVTNNSSNVNPSASPTDGDISTPLPPKRRALGGASPGKAGAKDASPSKPAVFSPVVDTSGTDLLPTDGTPVPTKSAGAPKTAVSSPVVNTSGTDLLPTDGDPTTPVPTKRRSLAGGRTPPKSAGAPKAAVPSPAVDTSGTDLLPTDGDPTTPVPTKRRSVAGFRTSPKSAGASKAAVPSPAVDTSGTDLLPTDGDPTTPVPTKRRSLAGFRTSPKSAGAAVPSPAVDTSGTDLLPTDGDPTTPVPTKRRSLAGFRTSPKSAGAAVPSPAVDTSGTDLLPTDGDPTTPVPTKRRSLAGFRTSPKSAGASKAAGSGPADLVAGSVVSPSTPTVPGETPSTSTSTVPPEVEQVPDQARNRRRLTLLANEGLLVSAAAVEADALARSLEGGGGRLSPSPEPSTEPSTEAAEAAEQVGRTVGWSRRISVTDVKVEEPDPNTPRSVTGVSWEQIDQVMQEMKGRAGSPSSTSNSTATPSNSSSSTTTTTSPRSSHKSSYSAKGKKMEAAARARVMAAVDKVAELILVLGQEEGGAGVPEVAAWCLSAMADLTTGSASYRQQLVEAGGLATVLDCMKTHPTGLYVQWQGCWVIANLSADKKIVSECVEKGGLEVVLQCMLQIKVQDVQAQACRALAGLTQTEAHRLRALELGAEAALKQQQQRFDAKDKKNAMMLYRVQKTLNDLLNPPPPDSDDESN